MSEARSETGKPADVAAAITVGRSIMVSTDNITVYQPENIDTVPNGISEVFRFVNEIGKVIAFVLKRIGTANNAVKEGIIRISKQNIRRQIAVEACSFSTIKASVEATVSAMTRFKAVCSEEFSLRRSGSLEIVSRMP